MSSIEHKNMIVEYIKKRYDNDVSLSSIKREKKYKQGHFVVRVFEQGEFGYFVTLVNEKTGEIKLIAETYDDFWYKNTVIEIPKNLKDCVANDPYDDEFQPIAAREPNGFHVDQHILHYFDAMGIDTSNLDEPCENMICALSLDAAEKFVDELKKLGFVITIREKDYYE